MAGGFLTGAFERALARTGAFCVCALLSVQAATAQTSSEPTYLDARERAEQDWEVLSQSASSLWEQASEALVPALSNPAVAVLALGAALLGGLTACASSAPPTWR